MKTKIFLGAIFILVAIQVNLSCRKEKSCEGCKENNKPPIAVAGPDQVITLPTDSISLDGSASSDPDGTISNWLWKKISGPASFNISNASASRTVLKNLVAGTYQFELHVNDNKGSFAKDTLQIIVDAVITSNHPPVANAGNDVVIILPVNTVTIDGSASTDPDNNIVEYAWTKIFGPASFMLSNSNAVQPMLSNLVQGIYQFELKVTDAGGLFAKDTVQVTVINQSPVCNDCKIAFVSNRDGNSEIYTCKADGSNIQRLTNDAGKDEEPSWSPDGTKIAFISDRSGNPELYIMNANGSNVIRKTFSGTYTGNPVWSPDGMKIVYSTLNNGSMNIWVINTFSGSPSLLFEAPGYDVQPTWSPDGTKIALVSDWAAYDFVYDIYTINANGTGFTALTGNIFDHFDYLSPDWSPNGAKISVTIIQTIGIDQYNTQIGIMNPNGTGITVIRSGAAPWSRTSWSDDGSMIVYTLLSGTRKDVGWVTTDGSSWGTIVTNGWDADWQN